MPDPQREPEAETTTSEVPGAGESATASAAAGARPSPAAAARQRLRRLLTKPGRGQLIAGVLVFLVAVGAVTQVRTHATDKAYSNARQDDLVQILDGLNSESRRLQGEIEDLEQTRQSLRSGADRERVARSETERRVGELGILAGTVPAVGQGVRITVTDPDHKLSPELMLEGIEELRDAGAEAIEINDRVRVVASTSFGGGPGALRVDGVKIKTPVVLDVIGDSDSLATGASFRGGFADQVSGNAHGEVRISKQDKVLINSLHRARDNQYAHPASSPTGRR
ncbi:DUF881 domain-containing protein [Microlunatus elymi]|uniref:DUF881 domain-containing protein n=1 Tax=Microlunatus elymi TaxID=2596828 RepID=A0A516PZW5_9ACTN|nr:DUF881 domain-containing protein [Microlunatus elymi]QDP96682.1 DUF881 domain-containing protein [Microlunatus elymi]